MLARIAGIIVGALLFVASARTADPPLAADLVLVKGAIWTGNPKQPTAEALAVRGDRIVAVGTTQEISALVGPQTKVHDLAGRRVVPGFYDSHVHFLSSGMRLAEVQLKDAASEEEMGRLLREFDKKLPPGRWMVGGDWDHDRALGGKLPTAELIDRHVKDRPVLLRRYDGHMAVANSEALKRAEITADTKDPSGGVIYRKQGTREPTGLLRDNAMSLVDRLIPAPGEDEIIEAVREAQREAREVGVTSVQDMDGSGSGTRRQLFRLYQRLARAGNLTVRIDLRWPLSDWKMLADLGVEADFGNPWVRIGGVKGFVDGSLGSSTAKMFKPFLNEPGSTGVWVTPREKLREYILGADKAGLSVAVHAIGDEANATLLDIFEEVAKLNGPRDRRFRIEHAQHLRPEDLARFGKLGVIPSLQPFHIIDDGRWAEGRIGAERCATSYACRGLIDGGARLAFGSDWAVAPLNPLPGIAAAVHRRTLDGKHPDGWHPRQKITVEEALTAYTLGSAYAGFQEKERGTLEVGKLADCVVLDRDILAAGERDRIDQTRVDVTMVGGKIVYERPRRP
jgi:predicted amidohydrolase YtcJ